MRTQIQALLNAVPVAGKLIRIQGANLKENVNAKA
jgi:hypothetical protein